jgi:hypothetical protein
MARPYSDPRSYSAAESEKLRKLYVPSSQAELLAAFPGRTLNSIRCQAGKLDLRKVTTPLTDWTPERDAVLRTHYPAIGAEGVAKLLKLKPQAVKRRAGRLKVYTLRFVAIRAASPAPTTEHDPRPRARNTLKPLQTSKARSQPVKRIPKKELSTPLTEILAAMRHPKCEPGRRMAFTKAAYHGMPAAIKAWDEWPTQQQAA